MQNFIHKSFQGFPKDIEYSHWQFPTLINGYVHSLTGSEFKVLWYILRHTFGWQKVTDNLSRSQISKGIKKRNGEIVDSGTGLSIRQVERCLKSLEEKGFILIKREMGKVSEITLNITNQRQKFAGTSDKNIPSTSDKKSPTIDNTINNTNTSVSSKKPYYEGYLLVEVNGQWKVRRGHNDFAEFSNAPEDWKKVEYK